MSGVVTILLLLFCGSKVGRTADPVVLPTRQAQVAKWHVRLSDEGSSIADGELPVLNYQRATTSLAGRWPRAHYIHPLYDLDGNVLTEDFPDDHRHHRGVFWAWHQLLVDGRPGGDGWLCEDFQWDVGALAATMESGTVRLHAEVTWTTKLPEATGDRRVDEDEAEVALSPAATSSSLSFQPVVAESTDIRVYPVQVADGHPYRCLDVVMRLVALQPNTMIGGSDDEKGYGGFSLRLSLDEGIEFIGPHGEVAARVTAIDAGPWLDFRTPRAGVLVICHHENPGHPQRWILRQEKSMQNVVFPGRLPVVLPTAAPLVLRYRMVIHRRDFPVALLNDLHLDFQAITP
ncbi:MAG: hypothetical protein KatS3mg111_4056 [Pirellulaceae bacterium]|nr:MAG: hypothetical protein KatS3mg111_4056 [Pirellulaceae bacterium]